MNKLLSFRKVGYLPAYNTENEQEVICTILITNDNIIHQNDEVMSAKNIEVLNIFDKHFNEYYQAITIYDQNLQLVNKKLANTLEEPILLYKTIKSARLIIKINKSVRLRLYDINTELIMDGVIKNGLFHGLFQNKKYKDGILFISPS